MAQLVEAPSRTPKGCGFAPQSGHIPRLQVQSLVGAGTGSNRSIFLSYISVSLSLSLFPLSLPLSLKSVNIYTFVLQNNNNKTSCAFHVIKTLLQTVEAFQEPCNSRDTSGISTMYAKPEALDSEDNSARSFLNLQITHVLQYPRCLRSIKHLTKQNKERKKDHW